MRLYRPRPDTGRATLAASLLAVAVLVLAACGAAPNSSGVASLVDPSATPDASASPSLDPEEAMLAFQRCMREHGIDVQVSTGEGGSGEIAVGVDAKSGDRETFEEANKACQPLLPRGGMDQPGASPDPELEEKMLAFARCMREHGVDFPDPVFTADGMVTIGSGPGEEGAPAFDPESEEFKAAQEACEDLMPGGPDGPGSRLDESGPGTRSGSEPEDKS